MKKLIIITVLSLTGLVTYSQSWTADSSFLYANPSTTKVGIGTTNPQTKLHVVGDMLLPLGSSYWIGM